MLAPLSPTAVPGHRIPHLSLPTEARAHSIPRSSLLTAALVPRILRLSLPTAVRAHRILRLSWRMVALGRRIPPLSLHNWPSAAARSTDVIRACNVDRTPRRPDHAMVQPL